MVRPLVRLAGAGRDGADHVNRDREKRVPAEVTIPLSSLAQSEQVKRNKFYDVHLSGEGAGVLVATCRGSIDGPAHERHSPPVCSEKAIVKTYAVFESAR